VRILYDFRETALAKSRTGQRDIDLYDTHSAETVWLMLRHPELRAQARVLLDQLLPVIQEILAGEQVLMTAAQLDAFEGLLKGFAEKSSPRLRADLRALQVELRQGAVLAEFGIRTQRPPPTPQR
jgi:hypothetical protein